MIRACGLASMTRMRSDAENLNASSVVTSQSRTPFQPGRLSAENWAGPS
jgi:hypothetical protein